MRPSSRPVITMLLASMLAACATAPPAPEHEQAGQPAPMPTDPPAFVSEEPAVQHSPRAIATRVEQRLGSEMLVPYGSDGPLLVATGNSHLGIVLGAGGLAAWRLDEVDLVTVPVEGEILPGTFGPCAIDLSRATPQGFRVRLETTTGEQDLYALDDGTAVPYVVQMVASTTARSELRDADEDGMAELVRYALVFEAPGRRELLVDLLEWQEGSFVHRASVPLLRRLNQRLADLQRTLTEEASDMDRLAAALTPIEGAPDPHTMLPAVDATVPPIHELAVELDDSTWRIVHEIALFPGPAIYRIEIDVIANPALTDPIRIIGLDD